MPSKRVYAPCSAPVSRALLAEPERCLLCGHTFRTYRLVFPFETRVLYCIVNALLDDTDSDSDSE
jgi:hypothetical protein